MVYFKLGLDIGVLPSPQEKPAQVFSCICTILFTQGSPQLTIRVIVATKSIYKGSKLSTAHFGKLWYIYGS